jgi:hypothetical protein
MQEAREFNSDKYVCGKIQAEQISIHQLVGGFNHLEGLMSTLD